MQTPNCTSSVLQTVQKNWWSTRTSETLHASLMAYIIKIVWSIQEQNSCVIELFPITAHTVGTLPWIIYFPFGYVWHYPGIAVLKIPPVDTCTFSLVWLAVVAGCASSPCELAFIMRQTVSRLPCFAWDLSPVLFELRHHHLYLGHVELRDGIVSSGGKWVSSWWWIEAAPAFSASGLEGLSESVEVKDNSCKGKATSSYSITSKMLPFVHLILYTCFSWRLA